MHILMMILDVLLLFSYKHVDFFNTLKIEQQFAIMTLGRNAKVTVEKNLGKMCMKKCSSMSWNYFFHSKLLHWE